MPPKVNKRASPDTLQRDVKRPRLNSDAPTEQNTIGKAHAQVLIQAALIFQYMDYSKKLGLQSKVPSHMTRRLELSWREYEGLRSQLQGDSSQSDLTHPFASIPPLPLPKSITLSTTIPSTIPLLPTKPDVPLPAPNPATSLQSEGPLPIPARLSEAELKTQVPMASPVPLQAASSLAFDGQAMQTATGTNQGLSEAADQSQTQQQHTAGFMPGQIQHGPSDFSDLDLDDLSQFINAVPTSASASAFGMDTTQPGVNPAGAAGARAGQGSLPEVIDLTAEDEGDIQIISAPSHSQRSLPAQKSSSTQRLQPPQQPAQSQFQHPSQTPADRSGAPSTLADEVLASLGLSDLDTPPGGGLAGGMDFTMGGGEHDFSALAQLFDQGNAAGGGGSNETSSAQTTQGTYHLPAPPTISAPNEQPPKQRQDEKPSGDVAGGPAGGEGVKQDSLEELLAVADRMVAADGMMVDVPVEEREGALARVQGHPQPESQSEAQPQSESQPQSQDPAQPSLAQTSTNPNPEISPNMNIRPQLSPHIGVDSMDMDMGMGMGGMGMGISGMGGNDDVNLGAMDMGMGGIDMSMGMDHDNMVSSTSRPGTATGTGTDTGFGGVNTSLQAENGFGDLDGIDLSDFNFGDGSGGGIDGEEFERLMAEFA